MLYFKCFNLFLDKSWEKSPNFSTVAFIVFEIFRENQTPPPRKLKRYFIFTVLLFVLSSVPMIFTKPLRPLADLTGIHTV